MHSFLKSCGILLCSISFVTQVEAQSESILEQLALEVQHPKKYSQNALYEESLFAPSSDSDNDMGEQLLLRRTPTQDHFFAKWDTYLIHSDNITNAEANTSSGHLFNSILHVGWMKPLNQNAFLTASVEESLYQYEGQFAFNFWNTKTSVGIVKIFPKHQIVTIVDVVNNYTRQNFASGKIHSITSLNLGASRTFFRNPETIIFVGLDLNFDLDSTADSADRNEYSLRVGYTKRLTSKFTATLFGDVSKYDYAQNNRKDMNYIVGVSLDYALSSNVTLHSSISYVNNDSNLAGLNYSSTLGSLGIGLKASF